MATIYNIAIIFEVEQGLSAKFAAKKFGWVGWRSAKSFSHIHHVYNNSFYSIAFSLYFSNQLWHLITIEGVSDIAVHVETHLKKSSVLKNKQNNNNNII